MTVLGECDLLMIPKCLPRTNTETVREFDYSAGFLTRTRKPILKDRHAVRYCTVGALANNQTHVVTLVTSHRVGITVSVFGTIMQH